MENRKISDSQIKSSSQLDENHSAKHSRLHLKANRENGGSWSALKNDVNQWLQVDLGSYIRVTGIATQGRNGHDEWVTKFRLQYGEDEDVFHFFEDPGGFAARVCIMKRFSQISLIPVINVFPGYFNIPLLTLKESRAKTQYSQQILFPF